MTCSTDMGTGMGIMMDVQFLCNLGAESVTMSRARLQATSYNINDDTAGTGIRETMSCSVDSLGTSQTLNCADFVTCC